MPEDRGSRVISWRPQPPLKIVCLGGGTGLPVLLGGFKRLSESAPFGSTSRLGVSAVVAMSDDGGSSGALRLSLGIPPVGDLRNCLLALSGGNSALADACQHRFTGDAGLQGHALGNLILAALYERNGELGAAVRIAHEIFQSRGSVYPVTEDRVTLCAGYDDGRTVSGQAAVPRPGRRIRSVWLEPSSPRLSPGAAAAIAAADAIVLSPGSLYTSIIATLLVPGVTAAMAASAALKIYVCNLLTQPGETDGFSASDHLRTLAPYLGGTGIDVCVVNSRKSSGSGDRVLPVDSRVVRFDEYDIYRVGAVPVAADLLTLESNAVRHDGLATARLVTRLARGAKRARAVFHESAES